VARKLAAHPAQPASELHQALQYDLVNLRLLPSYRSERLSEKEAGVGSPDHIAALDGLRGLACLIVLNQHFSLSYSKAFLEGWNGTQGRNWIIQLPIIRILWAGNAMVAVFFVISGYVLSYKPLKQMQTRSDQVFRAISSSIIRRGIRLYLPTFAATFICMLLVRAGAFERARALKHLGYASSAGEDPPPRLHSFPEQLDHWWSTVIKMLYPWTWGDVWQDYDPHLWTIPTEFRCSMLLFLIQCGVARLRPAFRTATIAVLVLFCAYTSAEHVVLFFAGMFMAEVDVLVQSRNASALLLPLRAVEFGRTSANASSRAARIALFIVGLYLASAPTSRLADYSFGYTYLISEFVPEWYRMPWYFWQSVGAILVVWSAVHVDEVKPLFINSFAQYLGRISFALYLVHGNILRSVLYSIMPSIWTLRAGDEGTTFRLGVAWLVGACVIVPLSFLAAETFWRFVDKPSIKFASLVEDRISISPPDDDEM
jgi:peptidoglycan/LPS O-acetylase OafA/YrhL